MTGRQSPPTDLDRDDVEPESRLGWVTPAVASELPGLSLVFAEVGTPLARRSPAGLRQRLRLLSDRFAGAQAINLRRQPIPAAYRVFFRHIGIDPDVTRTPIEEAVTERMFHGGFQSRNLVDDALLIALVETGVPVWALDATTVQGELGVRLAQDGEPLGDGPDAPVLPAGRLVVADQRRPVAVLFGEIAPGHGVTRASRRLMLFAVLVAGVPPMYSEEALWTCAAALQEA